MGYFFLKNWYLYGSTFKFRGSTSLPKPNLSTPRGVRQSHSRHQIHKSVSIPLLTLNTKSVSTQYHSWHLISWICVNSRCVNPTCDTTHNAWHTAYSPLANKEIPKIQYKWGRSTYGWSSDLIWWYWCRLVWGVSRGVECGLHSDRLLVYSLVLGDGDNVLMGHDQTIWCC